jgi:hypothetical protein
LAQEIQFLVVHSIDLFDFLNGSRWSISVNTDEDGYSHTKKTLKQHKEAKSKLPISIMNNYFSIGADAKIALDFHAAREKNPAAFSSQAVNKIEYAKNYSKDLFKQSCKKLKDNISVFEVRLLFEISFSKSFFIFHGFNTRTTVWLLKPHRRSRFWVHYAEYNQSEKTLLVDLYTSHVNHESELFCIDIIYAAFKGQRERKCIPRTTERLLRPYSAAYTLFL